MTGAEWIYDNHGPNAVGNLIVRAAEGLLGHEISIEQGNDKVGNYCYWYGRGPSPRFEPRFSEAELAVIEATMGKYGHMNATTIARESKKSAPFELSPARYERLVMPSLRQAARARIEQARRSRRAAHFASGAHQSDSAGQEEPPGSPVDSEVMAALTDA